MQDVVLGNGYEGGVVDAVVVIEMFVLGRDECLPEYRIDFFVSNRRAVLTEELADQLPVSAVDHRGSGGALVLDGRHRG